VDLVCITPLLRRAPPCAARPPKLSRRYDLCFLRPSGGLIPFCCRMYTCAARRGAARRPPPRPCPRRRPPPDRVRARVTRARPTIPPLVTQSAASPLPPPFPPGAPSRLLSRLLFSGSVILPFAPPPCGSLPRQPCVSSFDGASWTRGFRIACGRFTRASAPRTGRSNVATRLDAPSEAFRSISTAMDKLFTRCVPRASRRATVLHRFEQRMIPACAASHRRHARIYPGIPAEAIIAPRNPFGRGHPRLPAPVSSRSRAGARNRARISFTWQLASLHRD
jgi:hypothetical protein